MGCFLRVRTEALLPSSGVSVGEGPAAVATGREPRLTYRSGEGKRPAPEAGLPPDVWVKWAGTPPRGLPGAVVR